MFPPQELQEALGEGGAPEQTGLLPAIGMAALDQPRSTPEGSAAAAELISPSESIS